MLGLVSRTCWLVKAVAVVLWATLLVDTMVCYSRQDINSIAFNPMNGSHHDFVLRDRGVFVVPQYRGCRGSGHKKPIPSLVSCRLGQPPEGRGVQHGLLVPLSCDTEQRISCIITRNDVTSIKKSSGVGSSKNNLQKVGVTNAPKLKAGLLNVRSACNKSSSLCEYVKDHELDIFCITETWLKSDNQSVVAEITPPGYTLQHIPRPMRRGGGVGIMIKDSIKTVASECQVFKSFEYIEKKIVIRSLSYLLVVVYRPPPSTKNSFTVPMFLDEFGAYLEPVLITKCNILICGDFNFQMNHPSHPDTMKFQALLNSTGLKQHVQQPTHRTGHMLDLVLTRECETISNIRIQDDLISDHSSVFFELAASKPPLPKKQIQYRKLKSIDMDKFKSDIINSGLADMQHEDIDVLVDSYNTTLSQILEKHAPLKTRQVTIHADSPWINDTIKQLKRDKRKAERKWRATGLEIHKQIYCNYRNQLNKKISEAKVDFYQQRIDESSHSQATLFKCVDELLGKKKTSALPSHDSPRELCDRMAKFFHDKIQDIHEGLATLQDHTLNLEPDPAYLGENPFTDFSLVSQDEVEKIIKKCAPKSCCLDPVPTKLVKECLDTLLPIITRIINQSLASAIVPKMFKLAAVTPILKKMDLIAEI